MKCISEKPLIEIPLIDVMVSRRALKREDNFFDLFSCTELAQEHALELNQPRVWMNEQLFVGPFASTLELLRGKNLNPFTEYEWTANLTLIVKLRSWTFCSLHVPICKSLGRKYGYFSLNLLRFFRKLVPIPSFLPFLSLSSRCNFLGKVEAVQRHVSFIGQVYVSKIYSSDSVFIETHSFYPLPSLTVEQAVVSDVYNIPLRVSLIYIGIYFRS